MKLWHGDPTRLRTRSIATAVAVLAGTLALLIGLTIWASVAFFGWLSNRAPGALEVVRTHAPAITRHLDEGISGAGEALEKWLDRDASSK